MWVSWLLQHYLNIQDTRELGCCLTALCVPLTAMTHYTRPHNTNPSYTTPRYSKTNYTMHHMTPHQATLHHAALNNDIVYYTVQYFKPYHITLEIAFNDCGVFTHLRSSSSNSTTCLFSSLYSFRYLEQR